MKYLDRLRNQKEKAHERNGNIIDMMNKGGLSVSDAKIMLQINSKEVRG